jgi:hypothetical protein
MGLKPWFYCQKNTTKNITKTKTNIAKNKTQTTKNITQTTKRTKTNGRARTDTTGNRTIRK